MDFSLTEEQRIFKEVFGQFCINEIQPLVEDAEDREEFPISLFPKMGALGYLGIRYPECYGGADVDKVTECIYMEEMFKVCRGIGTSIFAHTHLGTYPIYKFGTKEQKQKYVVPAVKGEKIAAFALTEPDAGSDVQSIRSTAVHQGDGYLLNGTKMFITNGGICHYVVVAAYTDRNRGYKGISLFIVEKEGQGSVVSRKLRKEGSRSSDTTELVFEACFVPPENLIGGREGGFSSIMETLVEGRVSIAAGCVGIAQAAFEASLAYAKERICFGKPITKYQAIAFQIADMVVEIELARTMAYRAAWLIDQGKDCTKEASIAKLFASEMAGRVTDAAMQVHGGYSYMREFPVGRYWRDARQLRIGEGTSEIHRIIISRHLGML